jgi:hypothetical protein
VIVHLFTLTLALPEGEGIKSSLENPKHVLPSINSGPEPVEGSHAEGSKI